jgi:tetratricopeptide (TPR) repeat protein
MKLAVVVFAAFKVWTATGVNTAGIPHLARAEAIETTWNSNQVAYRRAIEKDRIKEANEIARVAVILAAGYARQSDMLATSLEELGITSAKLGNHQESIESFKYAIDIAKSLKHWPASRIAQIESAWQAEKSTVPASSTEIKQYESPNGLVETGRSNSEGSSIEKSRDAESFGEKANLAFRNGRLKDADKFNQERQDCSLFLPIVKNEQLTEACMLSQKMDLAEGRAKTVSFLSDVCNERTGSYLSDDDPIRITNEINKALADGMEENYSAARDRLKELHEKQKDAFQQNLYLEGKYNLATGWICLGQSFHGGITPLLEAQIYADRAIESFRDNSSARLDYAQSLRLHGRVLYENRDRNAIEQLRLALKIASSELPLNHPYLAPFHLDYGIAALELGNDEQNGRLHGQKAFSLAQQKYDIGPNLWDATERERMRTRLDRYKSFLSNAMSKGKLKPLMMRNGDIEL